MAAARLINDSYATLAQQYPGKLAAFVSLPLPHIDASLREMERGLDQLGMLGVSMTCSCFDRSTAEAEFEPLYAEMNRRGAVLNYHPIQNGICSPMINDYRFTVSVGASLEDSAIVLHLIARRVPERYPNIKYVIPHVGGIIPMLLQRLDNQAPSQHPDLPERPSVTARRFYYDTVSHGSQAALLCAWKALALTTSWRGATTRSYSPSRHTGRRSTTSASAACRPRTPTRSSTTTPRYSWVSNTKPVHGGVGLTQPTVPSGPTRGLPDHSFEEMT